MLRTPFFRFKQVSEFLQVRITGSKLKKKQIAMFRILLILKRYNAPNIFYFFLNFFSALYKFWNVLIVCYYVTYKFNLYFTLAKEEHKSIICKYILVILIVFLFSKKKKKRKKNTQALAWVKNSNIMPQSSHYLSFLLGKGGKPLYLKTY